MAQVKYTALSRFILVVFSSTVYERWAIKSDIGFQADPSYGKSSHLRTQCSKHVLLFSTPHLPKKPLSVVIPEIEILDVCSKANG